MPRQLRIEYHGAIYHDETIVDDIVLDAGIKAGVNTGIAIVTPASIILDILNCEEMTKQLREIEAGETYQNTTTPD